MMMLELDGTWWNWIWWIFMMKGDDLPDDLPMIRLMELAHGTCWLLIYFDLMILNKTDTKYGIQLLHKPNLPVSWALRTLAKKVCVWLI